MSDACPNKMQMLMVADARGHIIERMARSWSQWSPELEAEVALTETVSLSDCCRRAEELGAVHWLDMRRGLRAVNMTRCPQVVTVHHYLPGEEDRIRELSESADMLTAVSRSWRERLERLTGKAAWLTPQSIDTTLFRPVTDKAARQREAGIPAGLLVLGFVGKAGANVRDRKGTDIFLQVVQALGSQLPCAVLLVGTGWNDMAKQLRAAGVLVLERSYDDCNATMDAYSLMDVLVVTAREEGGPATVLEAMACGVPVVSSPVGHVPELINNGTTGVLCGVGDVTGYLEALVRIGTDPVWADCLAAAGREEVRCGRDDRVVIPRIDFQGLWTAARANYSKRSQAEKQGRKHRKMAFQWRLLLRRLWGGGGGRTS